MVEGDLVRGENETEACVIETDFCRIINAGWNRSPNHLSLTLFHDHYQAHKYSKLFLSVKALDFTHFGMVQLPSINMTCVEIVNAFTKCLRQK